MLQVKHVGKSCAIRKERTVMVVKLCGVTDEMHVIYVLHPVDIVDLGSARSLSQFAVLD